MHSFLFTSESVTEGHPDKICDQISDAVLDACLAQDPMSRVAVETCVKDNELFIIGELTTQAKINPEQIARSVIREIGYTDSSLGFSADTVKIRVSLSQQSSDIAQGVGQKSGEIGAGDQGCIKKGALIKTAGGFVPIERVKVGSMVVTPYGLKRVLGVRKTGVKSVIEIGFSNGMRLECTPEHRVLCYARDGSTYWRAAEMLTHEDFVCALKPSESHSSMPRISKVARQQFFTKYNHRVNGPDEVTLDERVGYVTGLLIGDGTCSRPKNMEISFGRDREFAAQVKHTLSKELHGRWRLLGTKDGMISLKIDSIVMRKHFANFGVGYYKASDKTTPKAIFSSPKSVISSYLRGLFDSDGTIVQNTGRKKQNIRIRLGSSSYALLQETQLLLNELGVTASILANAPKGRPVGKEPRYKSRYDSFVLSVKGFESYQAFGREIGFYHPKKKKRLAAYLRDTSVKPRNSREVFLVPHPHKLEMIGEGRIGRCLPFAVTTVRMKRDKGEAEVYDLEIEDKNVFSANGIYVHNSMFGYADRQTPELMPMPISLAHKLAQRLTAVRKDGTLPYLRPDGKTQVTIRYEDSQPKEVTTVVVSAQHNEDVTLAQLRRDIRKHVIDAIVPADLKSEDMIVHINPTGRFVTGGPVGDSGLTGRKIIVDTYGGWSRHGGGCFSGKDPTKVDRSAAYAARQAAKSVVAAGLADKCEIQLAYAIGVAQPVSIHVTTFGTGKVSDEEIEKIVAGIDFRPAAIIERLNLRQPIFRATAAYGHFGRKEFPWENPLQLASTSVEQPVRQTARQQTG